MIIFVDSENDIGKRLDIFIEENCEFSRTYIDTLIKEGNIKINDIEVLKSSYKTKLNDAIDITDKEIEELDLKPENIPLNIVYEV